MIGINGGLIGKANIPDYRYGIPGLWTPSEQITAKRQNKWPQAPSSLADSYIAAVEAADGQALEVAVKNAYYQFINDCTTDGNIQSIGACCILAGARTLSGALVPLIGPAPTNVGFSSANYARKGLPAGVARLLSNRLDSDDPIDSRHLALYSTTVGTANGQVSIGTAVNTGTFRVEMYRAVSGAYGAYLGGGVINIGGGTPISNLAFAAGLNAMSLSNGTVSYVNGSGTINYTLNYATGSVAQGVQVGVFARGDGTNPLLSGTISYYSIGSGLPNVSAYCTRVNTLISQLYAAVP